MRYKIIFVLIWCFITSSEGFGQGSSGQNFISSPYSNYGLGDWTQTNQYNAFGAHSTFSGLYSYSMMNPATLGNVRFTTLDVASNLRSGTTTSGSEKQEFLGGNFEYLSLALPVWKYLKKRQIGFDTARNVKRWKYTPFGASTAITLRPLTTKGYSYFLDNQQVLPTRTSYTGSGGVSQLMWNTGFRFSDHFMLGYGTGFLFGNTSEKALFSIPDSLELGLVEDSRTLVFRGMQQQVGALIQFKIDTTYHKIGGYYEWYGDVNAIQNRLTRTMAYNVSFTSPLDTIINEVGVNRGLTLPPAFGFGYTLRIRNDLQLSADYRRQLWSKYDAFFDSKKDYQDREDYNFNLIINPLDYKLGNVKKMPMPIRLGYGLTHSHISLNGSRLEEQRYSVGVGIPMIRRYFDNSVITNMIHVNLQYMTRGAGLAYPKEQFITLGIGLQLGDIWFAKRKYD